MDTDVLLDLEVKRFQVPPGSVLTAVSNGAAKLDARQLLHRLADAGLDPAAVLREMADAVAEAAREEEDFRLAAERRSEPEGATWDDMRKKYGL